MQKTVPSTSSTPKTPTKFNLRKVIIKSLQRRHDDVYMRGLRRPRA